MCTWLVGHFIHTPSSAGGLPPTSPSSSRKVKGEPTAGSSMHVNLSHNDPDDVEPIFFSFLLAGLGSKWRSAITDSHQMGG